MQAYQEKVQGLWRWLPPPPEGALELPDPELMWLGLLRHDERSYSSRLELLAAQPKDNRVLAQFNRASLPEALLAALDWLHKWRPGSREALCRELDWPPARALDAWLSQVEFHLRCGPEPFHSSWEGLTQWLIQGLPPTPGPRSRGIQLLWSSLPRSQALRQQWQMRTGQELTWPAPVQAVSDV